MTDWKLEGTMLIACNCDYGCPCNFNALPTHGDCEGGWIWNVESGHFGDTRLDGLSFADFSDYPGAIHQGDGVALFLIDERADEAQREAITRLLRGEEGGPWAIFANTLREVHGPHSISFDVTLDGLRSRVTAGDVLELSLTTIKNPVTGAEVHPGAVLPEGLVCKEMSFGASEVFRLSDGIGWDHSGRYAAIAPFSYASG